MLLRIGAEKRPIVIKIIMLANKINRPDTNRSCERERVMGICTPLIRIQTDYRDESETTRNPTPINAPTLPTSEKQGSGKTV